MTEAEYEQRLSEWAEAAKRQMAAKLSSGTHGTGLLAKKIKFKIKEDRREGFHYVGFTFKRYGVYVEYGVGRGWVRHGGHVVAGSKVKEGSEIEHLLKKKGYSKEDIRSYVIRGSGGTGRHPVSWFDSTLMDNVESLADIAQEYYGFNCMEIIDSMISRMTIRKKMP